jgi:MFS family permease
MWRLGFFFHEMAFGLLSIFLPLYVMSMEPNNGLFYIGILSALALLVAIPSSFFWGYISDKTRHYKRYILLSFFASAIFLYLFIYATSVMLLIVLYAAMAVLHVAHEAPKNVLVSEMYSHEHWERAFAFYEGFTEIGWLIGLLLGFALTVTGFSAVNTLFLCSLLNLAAFFLSIFLVADPLLVFERSLVSIEKSVDFTQRGVFLASKLLDGVSTNLNLRRENVNAFCTGLVLFSLATSVLFTPMPVFVSGIAATAGLSQSIVFAVFVLNSAGGFGGYLLSGLRSDESRGKSRLRGIVLLRSLLAFLLVIPLSYQFFSVGSTAVILVLLGLLNALFLVATLSLSMELIPAGRAGLFNVLIGVGGALGSFVGPFVAQSFGFFYVFLIAGAIFLVALLFFKIFR